jgi:hypothetical protein
MIFSESRGLIRLRMSFEPKELEQPRRGVGEMELRAFVTGERCAAPVDLDLDLVSRVYGYSAAVAEKKDSEPSVVTSLATDEQGWVRG